MLTGSLFTVTFSIDKYISLHSKFTGGALVTGWYLKKADSQKKEAVQASIIIV